MANKSLKNLIEFIRKNPTAFHLVEETKKILIENGFLELSEGEAWNINRGGKYFVTRNGSSIISFVIPKNDYKGYMIMTSHSDSPCFKIKENPEIEAGGLYVKLNVEKYGGMLCGPWFDRPLSVAGRIVYDNGNGIIEKLINIDRDLLLIPSLAIHMDRERNKQANYNVQEEMLPLFSLSQSNKDFLEIIAENAKIKKEDILAHDLFLYDRTNPSIWGAKKEFFSCSRLDDQECVYTSLMGFLKASNTHFVTMHAVFDNEEVGSSTKQGADSTFLYDTLKRINLCMKKSEEEFMMNIYESFMVSADNAHALHPNYQSKADPINRPVLNGGIVIKYSGNQKYTTDAFSSALCKKVCKKAKVPYQIYTNRSDIIGGSTLGNISSSHISIDSVDIGLAQLAMHSPYETAGCKDVDYMIDFSKCFFETE